VTADHRICFVGDSFVQGTADNDCLGWTGRVAAAARRAGNDVTAYNLGIRRDTSADIRKRWRAECTARLRPDCNNRIVFSFGANDMTMENGALRVAETDSVANFAAILAEAGMIARVLVIGPLPVNESGQDLRISVLCRRYAQTAAQLLVPYLPLADILTGDARWRRAVADGDGTHPGNDGYALIAGHVLQWPDWCFPPVRPPD